MNLTRAFSMLFWTVLIVCATRAEEIQAPGTIGDETGPEASYGAGLTTVDPFTLQGHGNILTDYPALNENSGTINVVIEIPAGTAAKWEVDKRDGALRWEIEDGRPRVVRYLGYPGNYGMVPRTLLPEEVGGDGDALDVLVLGPALEHGLDPDRRKADG